MEKVVHQHPMDIHQAQVITKLVVVAVLVLVVEVIVELERMHPKEEVVDMEVIIHRVREEVVHIL